MKLPEYGYGLSRPELTVAGISITVNSYFEGGSDMFWASRAADTVEAILRALISRMAVKIWALFIGFVVLLDFCFRNKAGRVTVAEIGAWFGGVEIGHLVAFVFVAPIAVVLLTFWIFGTYREFYPKRD